VRSRTVEVMRCVECGREKHADERGWVTVLSPSATGRMHYCPNCMGELVRRAYAVDGSAEADPPSAG
jgi:predicted RNA-binding Zn-ribbon protein involved in translation (DUF1610 family)